MKATATPGSAALPSSRKSKLWQRLEKRGARIALLCFTFAILFFGYQWFLSSERWHADLAIADLDCSHPTVCRYRVHTNSMGRDATGKPFRFSTNDVGFRGADVPIRRQDPSTVRVQMYGDSMIFGIGVDDGHTLPEALQGVLQQRLPGRQVEVMNFGMPMNYLLSNLRTYEAFGRQYQPDIVIFASPRLQPHDLNWRVREIKESPFLTSMLATPRGRWFVNFYQKERPEWPWSSNGKADLRNGMQVLAMDQRERDMRVYFFEFFEQVPAWMRWFISTDIDNIKKGMLPADLKFGEISTGMTIDDYRGTIWVLAGDGHPTVEGHEHFAAVIADRILRDLEASPQRAVAVDVRR